MKEVRLHSLTLKNFKGISNFVFTPGGNNADVLGGNASGKTTLNDGWLWLLFDKDSQNKSKFEIKTLDSNNNVIHKLHHEVEGILSVNGKMVTLHKIYKEKWTITRGTSDESFSGNETDYYIDGVPKKKKDYETFVNEIVKEDVFKLMTSPTFFNEQVDWKDRRRTLIEVAGNVTDQEVIDSNEKLNGLAEILGDRSTEDHKKVIIASQAKINEELKFIPVRMDEIRKGMPTEEDQTETWNARTIELEKLLDENATEIHNINNGQAIQDKKNEIKNAEYELADLKRSLEGDSKDKEYALKARLQEEESNLNIMKSKGSSIVVEITTMQTLIQNKQARKSELLAQYNEADKSEFTHTGEHNCPTCKQELPKEQVSAVREKALADFNTNRTNKLTSINAAGKELKAEIETLNAKLEMLEKDKLKQVDLVNEKKKVVDKLNIDLKSHQDSIVDVSTSPEYVNKHNKIQGLKTELNLLNDNAISLVISLREKSEVLRKERNELNELIAKFAGIEASKKRIVELEAQEKKLTGEYKRLARELYLIEQFVKTKVDLMEELISNKFELARFKLFKQNVNGGVEDTCEVTYNGVPFSSLNNASRINVGLDIIRTLSKHYGIQAPIFIDNAESVTNIIEMDAQVIRLIVSGNDKTLRIEGK